MLVSNETSSQGKQNFHQWFNTFYTKTSDEKDQVSMSDLEENWKMSGLHFQGVSLRNFVSEQTKELGFTSVRVGNKRRQLKKLKLKESNSQSSSSQETN